MKKIKRFLGTCLIVSTVFCAFGKVFVHANTPKTVIFSGIDGKKISVSTNQTFSEQKIWCRIFLIVLIHKHRRSGGYVRA